MRANFPETGEGLADTPVVRLLMLAVDHGSGSARGGFRCGCACGGHGATAV